MAWHSIGPTLILNAGAYPGGWETVDLTLDSLGNPTGLPGARVLALIAYTHGGGWAAHEAVRPQDDAADWMPLVGDGQGCCSSVPDDPGTSGIPKFMGAILPTDAAGQIGFAANAAIVGAPRSLWVLGYLDWTDTWAPGGTTVYGPGAMPVAMTDLDISGTIGAIDALCFFRHQWTAGGVDRYGLRRYGDTETYVWTGGVAPLGAACVGSLASATLRRGLCATADAGIVEHMAAAAQDGQLDLLGYAPATIAAAEVFAAAAPPAAWGTTLDLTVDTGAAPTGLTGESFALLRFTLRAGAGGIMRPVACRRPGDALNYLSPFWGHSWPGGTSESGVYANDRSVVLPCSTDALGQIEWAGSAAGGEQWQVELISFVGSVAPPVPPVVTGTAPSGISVAVGAAIEFSTTDDTQVIEATIALTLQDPLGATHLAVVAGVIQAGYSGSITPVGTGFDVSVTKDGGMAEGIWTATAYCEDGSALSDTDVWHWYVHSGAFLPWEPVT